MPGGGRRRGRGRIGARGRSPVPNRTAHAKPWEENWWPASAKEATCTVCQYLMVEPARLPCGHRFCLKCVRAEVANGPGCCPLCRRRSTGWLRRATLDGRLVDEPLWNYIQERFSDRLGARNAVDEDDGGGGDGLEPNEVIIHRKLCAPGEIRSEYEAELQRTREQRRLLEEKEAQKSKDFIRQLQEEESNSRSLLSKIAQEDEKYARKLSMTLNRSPEETSSTSLPKTTATDSRPKNFYNHLNKSVNGCQTKTLDNYVLKSSSKSHPRKLSPPLTATSPELISTAGRCGRFLKKIFNGQLWGLNAETGNSSESSHSKVEPKVWELQKNCPNTEHELSVNSGIVVHRNSSLPQIANLNSSKKEYIRNKIDSDIDSEDSISQELRYFKPIQPNPVLRYNRRLINCQAVTNYGDKNLNITNDKTFNNMNSIDALEKLRGTEISISNFNSAFVCLLAAPQSRLKTNKIDTDQSTSELDSKKRKFKTEIANNKNNQKGRLKRDSNAMNSTKEINSTPKKSSLRIRNNKVSQSCSKYESKNDKLQTRVSARLKRSLSFNDNLITAPNSQNSTICNIKSNQLLNVNEKSNNLKKIENSYSNGKAMNINGRNGNLNGKNGNSNDIRYNRKLRTNGHLEKSEIAHVNSKNGSHNNKIKHETMLNSNNHNHKDDISNGGTETNVDFQFQNIDPAMLKEQKRIEEIIAQEKKDLALAKKLQRQLGGQIINTGYTLRTASKRQATLTEILPPSKRMKI